MIKQTRTYTDYNGVERTEDFFFNLTKAEVMELEMGLNGGLSQHINQLLSEQDNANIVAIFKKILNLSYGKKSLDGRTFVKNEENLAEFMSTEAYSDIFIELSTNADAAAKFIDGVLPKDLNTLVPKSVVTPSNT